MEKTTKKFKKNLEKLFTTTKMITVICILHAYLKLLFSSHYVRREKEHVGKRVVVMAGGKED